MSKETEREIGSGRYTYTGGLDRVCVCGHRLGEHSAARTVRKGIAIQDCLHDGSDDCGCKLFKPARKGKVK